MKQIEIHCATQDDVNSIIQLWCELVKMHHEIEPAIYAYREDAYLSFREYIERCIGDANQLVLVGVLAGEVTGYLMVVKSQRPPVVKERTIGMITECCVDKRRHRLGIGAALVAKAVEWCRNEGIKDLEVGYAVGNPPAIEFWMKQGFKPYRAVAFQIIE
jgi:GNAT superfamily N-acetyltransferase